jgi:hypothetical protein
MDGCVMCLSTGMDGCVMCLSTCKMQDNQHKKNVLIKYRVQEHTHKKSPVEARFSAPVQTGPGAHRASYKMVAGSLSLV